MMREKESIAGGESSPFYPPFPAYESSSPSHGEPCSTRCLVVIHGAALQMEGYRPLRTRAVHYVERLKLWCTWNGARHGKLQGPAYTGRCLSRRGLSFSVRGAVLDTEGFGAEALLVS